MGNPIIMNRGIVNGVEKIETLQSIQDLKIVVYGTALTVLVGVLVFIIKEIWEAWKKKGDRTEEKLDFLVTAIHRLEVKFDNIEKDIVPHQEVLRIAREEVEHYHKTRART